jgi:dipeptidyl aminopeptidase/acylaminoacyl peptidase
MNDVDVPWQNSLKLAEQLSSDDVRLILLKDGEHRLSREQDLQILISTLAELIDASQSAVC